LKKTIFFIFFIFTTQFCWNQEVVNDSISKDSIHRWELNLDVVSRYIWRGQSWGGNYVAFQPSAKYNISKKIAIGTWATHNFQSNYFYNDGTPNRGYQEIDFYLSYTPVNFMTIEVWDYYWPTVSRVEGVTNDSFNYSNNGVKSVDLSLLFDFSDLWLPFNATLSTLIAGNDFRYNANGENPKQNFTTYAEIGYTFENVFPKSKMFKQSEVELNTGIVLNNQAAYYTSASYSKPSVVNLSTKFSKVFKLSNSIKIPVFIQFVHNASNENTHYFGKNFLVYGLNLSY
jgi:Bacterial protein of unknown function (Gcw_chp)